MDLSLRRLRILREVAEHGGVTAAAQATRYSASGISQQISALEQEVGSPILEREGRGVRLTSIGQVLLEHAGILLDAEGAARTALERAQQTLAVDLTVGVFSTVAAGLVPLIARDLAAHHPQIRLRTREIDVEEAVRDVRHGHLDLAFLIDYPEASEPWPTSLSVVPCGLDRLHLVTSAGRFDRDVVALADLADEPWVLSGTHTYYGRAVRAACREAGFALRVTHEVNEQATALAMVAGGLGITLMSDLGRSFLYAGVDVDVLELDRPLHRQLLLAHDATAADRPAVRVFLDSALRAASVAAHPSRSRRRLQLPPPGP